MKLRVLASLLSVLVCSAQAAAPAHYSVSSLGDFYARDMNNLGQVVGGFISGQYAGQAGIYSNGVASTLAGLSGVSTLSGINDSGQIVGNAGTYESEGFIYSGGTMTMLTPSGNGTFSAVGINNAGQVGGTYYGSGAGGEYTDDAAIYSNGSISHANFGGLLTRVSGISENGAVYGSAGTADGMVAFTYQNGVMTDYSSQLGNFSVIADVNDKNQLVGTNMEGHTFPSYFISGGVARYAGDNVGLSSLNNAGLAVGSRYAFAPDGSGGVVGGLLWIDGASYDLNSLIDPAAGWTITSASKINERNQILAEGCNASGCGSLLLSPLAAVPEAETYAMMLLGVGIIGAAARRRRKQAATV